MTVKAKDLEKYTVPEAALACGHEPGTEHQADLQAVWDMLLLDGNCSDHTLPGAAKLRRILDDLIEARRANDRR